MRPLLEKSRKDIFNMMLTIAYFTICYLMPVIFNSPWKPSGACRDEPLLRIVSALFGWAVVGSWVIFKIIWHLIVSTRSRRGNMVGNQLEYTSRWEIAYAAIDGFYTLIAVPIWFYASIICWVSPFNKDCL